MTIINSEPTVKEICYHTIRQSNYITHWQRFLPWQENIPLPAAGEIKRIPPIISSQFR